MMEPGDLQCLKAIALMGGCRGPVWISSQSLGDTLAASPQTASRRLRSLESQRFVDRSLRPDGQYVAVTKEGEGPSGRSMPTIPGSSGSAPAPTVSRGR